MKDRIDGSPKGRTYVASKDRIEGSTYFFELKKLLMSDIVMQRASDRFMYTVITESYNFQRYRTYAEKHGLVRDVCTLESMSQMPSDPDDYVKVIQKSELWLYLRAQAAGTASSIGKLIKSIAQYPTFEDVTELWREKIQKVPFRKTSVVCGHMKWGVGYEDPALVHFAVANNLVVAQVGTVSLPMTYIMKIMPEHLTPEECKLLGKTIEKYPEIMEKHFLVSPDGIVGRRDGGAPSDLPSDQVGMLEIKCISPFHHIANDDDTLSWVSEMETRQWYHPEQIPYVYVTQTTLQAISGLLRFGHTAESTMWLIRWSPIGFSEFKTGYAPLIRMGIVTTVLYLALAARIRTEEDLPFRYMPDEVPLERLLASCYKDVLSSISHRYVDHYNLYPEFRLYKEITKDFKFREDPDEAG